VTMLTTLLVACVDASNYDARRALPEETQRAAFAQCAEEMNLSHWLQVHKLKSRDGLLHVVGSDGSGVLVGEANGVNRCAAAKLDAVIASN